MPLQPSAVGVGSPGFQTTIQADRQFIKAAFRGKIGILNWNDFKVTSNPTSHAMDVEGGYASLAGPNAQDQGHYFPWSESAETIAWPAPSSSPRIDSLILRVADPQYGTVTGSVGARWDIIQGVPTSSPVARSDIEISTTFFVPGGWMRVADIRVNVADTGVIPGGQVTDRRRDDDAWKTWTPTYEGITVGNGLVEAFYKKIDSYKTDVVYRFTLGSTSSITDTVLIGGLPFDPSSPQGVPGYISSSSSSRSPVTGAAGPGGQLANRVTTVAQSTGMGPGNPFAWTSGASLVLTGSLKTSPW